jgi:hypothetical protein
MVEFVSRILALRTGLASDFWLTIAADRVRGNPRILMIVFLEFPSALPPFKQKLLREKTERI